MRKYHVDKLKHHHSIDQAAFEYLKDVILNEHGTIDWTFTPINAFDYIEAAVAEEWGTSRFFIMTMY